MTLIIDSNTFQDNSAVKTGSVLSVSDMKKSANLLILRDNIFLNNSCTQKGGVFSYQSVNLTVNAKNNIYTNNMALVSGGVGYTDGATLEYMETNGTYISISIMRWMFDITY